MLSYLFAAVFLGQNPLPDKPIELTGHKGTVWSVAWNPKTETLASANQDELILWDVPDRKEVRRSSDAFDPIAFSRSGKWLAATSRDGVVLLDPNTLVQKKEWTEQNGFKLQEADEFVSAMTFAPDEKWLLVGTSEGTIFRLSVDTESIKPVEAHDSQISSICFSPDGKLMATTSLDRKAKIWNASTWKSVHVEQFLEPTTCSCFSPDGSLVAFGADDGAIKILDAKSGKVVSGIATSGSLSSVLFLKGTRVAVFGGFEGEKGGVLLFPDSSLISPTKYGLPAWPWTAAVSAKGDQFALAADSGKVFVVKFP